MRTGRRTNVGLLGLLVHLSCGSEVTPPRPDAELSPVAPRLIVTATVSIAAADETPGAAGPWSHLGPRPRSAGQKTLILESAHPYALGRYYLGQRNYQRALDTLTATTPGIFEDRMALAAAEAHLAKRQLDPAIEAFTRALRGAQVPSVSEAAADGLVRALEKKGDHQGLLRLLEGLLGQADAPERWDWVLLRAQALARAGLDEEAWDAAAHLMEAYPSTKLVEQAQKLQRGLKVRRLRRPISAAELQVWQVAARLRAGDGLGADRLLRRIRRGRGVDGQTIDLLRAEILEVRGSRREERALLSRLYESVSDKDRPKILLRLSELERGRRQSRLAQRVSELVEQYPDTAEAARARLLLASEPFADGRFLEASALSVELLEADSTGDEAEAARWLAAWSAYLGGESGLAAAWLEDALSQPVTLNDELRFRYWLGRAYQRQGKEDDAALEFQRAAERAPLRYYGLLPAERLAALGRPGPLSPPEVLPEAPNFGAAAELLGPDRPVGFDRAAAFAVVGLRGHALEELLHAAAYYRAVGSMVGQGAAADLAASLGSFRTAFYSTVWAADASRSLPVEGPGAWRALVRAYPKAYWSEISAAAATHGLEPELVLAIVRTETHFDEQARSVRGARGLMQLLPATARDVGRRAKGGALHARQYRSPASNVWLGSWYLRSLIDRYDGRLEPAIGAYNAGPGAMDRWLKLMGEDVEADELIERVPYDETRAYLQRVGESLRIYRLLVSVER